MKKEEYFELLPLTRTWLEDIVDAFLKRPNGVGEVDAIALAVKRNGRDVGDKPESTVTRTINNYCANANDEERKTKHPIFERVSPATYRLLSYPDSPDLIEIQNIQFDESGYKKAWKYFVDFVKNDPKWKELSKREMLTAFAMNIPHLDWLGDTIKAHGGTIDQFKAENEER
jgi:hypothetical protein